MRRPLVIVALVGALSVLGLGPPAPAHAAASQTVTFSTTPPTGKDWFFGDIGGYIDVGYVADASATSGLPVSYSIAPESAGICRIAAVFDHDFMFGTGAGIEFLGAGTCTVRADQAGDDDYLPAAQVAQSFTIEKVGSTLVRVKATKSVAKPWTFKATLLVPYRVSHSWTSVAGYAEQTVAFSIAGTPVCSATTDADGLATCHASFGLANVTRLRVTATYAGDANYTGASASGWVTAG